MAGREKKPALNKKQIPSPVPPKEGAGNPENVSSDTKEMPNIVTATRRKPIAKRTIKRKLRVGFKPTKKKPALKIAKALFSVAQASLDAKKATLIKNGISAPKRIRKPKGQAILAPKIEIKIEPNDDPPVLEPMEPLPSENGVPTEKKEPKKRTTKKTASSPPDIQDETKPILDPEVAVETTANSTDEATKKITVKKGGKPAKKTKEVVEEKKETLDDVMNDLAERINLDTDVLKMKKIITRKLKMDSPKRKTFKKEGLVSLNKDLTNDSSVLDTKVIDMLDLNVSKRPRKQLGKKRRHSIEKFPATPSSTDASDGSAIAAFTLFPSTPRSVSPRSKRGSKIRQSIEASTRRSSPYTTRSDSPARILRNGKQRKLKDFLLEGIETVYQKRRRLCSDLSGSELSISRNSGFESDTSSYSDLAPPLDNSGDVSDNQKDGESASSKTSDSKKDLLESSLKNPIYAVPDEMKNLDIKSISTKFTAILKRSLSTEAAAERQVDMQAAAAANGALESAEELPPNIPDNNITDTNSNLYSDVKPDITNLTPNIPIKTEFTEDFSDSQSNINIKLCPESKVPEKNFILDIMKQTFNEQEKDDQEKDDPAKDEQEKDYQEKDYQEKGRRPTRSSARIKKTVDKSEEKATIKLEEKVANKPEEKIANKTEENVAVKSDEKPDLTMTALKFYGAPDENSDKDSSVNQPVDSPAVEAVAEPEKVVETEDIKITPPPESVEAESPPFVAEEEEKPISVKKTEEVDVDGLVEIEEVESKSELQSEMLMKALVAETAEYVEKTLLGKGSNLDETEDTDDIEVDDIFTSTNGDKGHPSDEKINMDSSNTENSTEEMQITTAAVIEETPENLAKKENILQALGLQSLKAAAEAKLREKVVPKQDNYTGTLKTVIKINRGMEKQKRRRNSLKMTIHKKGKSKDGVAELGRSEEEANYRISKESGTAPWRHHGTNSSDTAGALRKTHYSNRSNLGNYGFGLILHPLNFFATSCP